MLRLCIDNDVGIRKLINNRDIKEVNKDNIYLLPENMMFDNFNLQHLAMVLKMDDEEINEISSYEQELYIREELISKLNIELESIEEKITNFNSQINLNQSQIAFLKQKMKIALQDQKSQKYISTLNNKLNSRQLPGITTVPLLK